MGDDSLILREDGALTLRILFPVKSLTYHNNLNVILVRTDAGAVYVLDVNSGAILQTSSLSADDGGVRGIEYAPGADRVFVWDGHGVCARTDYNGVLLLHTALQTPLASTVPNQNIKVELTLSEAILLRQCLENLPSHSIEGLGDFIEELKTSIDWEPVTKGVKAQKWSTVKLDLPHSTLRLVTAGVVQELKSRSRRIPALAIASAIGQQANYLVPCSRDEESRALMYSEAERKETFKRWPHMDYKWALPARMAQAGFYHQPSPSGDDRAMCFTCLVCLVCWEKSDEPWVEHERHSPNCPFVRGEYTHNVPISVTNATACAVPSSDVTIVSAGNLGDLVASGTEDGKVNIWKFDCGLKRVKYINISPYDSIFSGVLCSDTNKVWSESLEKDSNTYSVELTAMAFVGMSYQQNVFIPSQTSEQVPDSAGISARPSLVCGIIITKTNTEPVPPVNEGVTRSLFDKGNVQAMNDENAAKSHLTPSNKLLFLLTYDIQNSPGVAASCPVQPSNSSAQTNSGGSKKVCALVRSDNPVYDEIYLQTIYPDDDAKLPHSLLEEHISNVINLNASSSKDDDKVWGDKKKMIVAQTFKVIPPPPPPTALLPEIPEPGQGSMLDIVGKISQFKGWTSIDYTLGPKLVDQTDAAVIQQDSLAHYLNMNLPLEISDLKWFEEGDAPDKIKVLTHKSHADKVGSQSVGNDEGFDSSPPQEELITQAIAIQCLQIPGNVRLSRDARITHLVPTDDRQYLLVVISTVQSTKNPLEPEPDVADADGDAPMEEGEPDTDGYFMLYKTKVEPGEGGSTLLEDLPVCHARLTDGETPVSVCPLPVKKPHGHSFATVGRDGELRLYSLLDLQLHAVRSAQQGPFMSAVYCTSVERLCVATVEGLICFYALGDTEKDSSGWLDEDVLVSDAAGGVPRVREPATPALATSTSSLDALLALTGSLGGNNGNTTVPYSAVVPAFWCELSHAQRSRFDRHHNNRTWRLQNTCSTWDEHVLELTVPHSVALAHIDFGFSLHVPCHPSRLPVIQVTLLKQNAHGIGHKKRTPFGKRSEPTPTQSSEADPAHLENPVNSEEYLQAHNAEILAGPLLLSSGLHSSMHSGTLILTSPRLYRAKGRTFLIHIKTLYDPAKDANKGSIRSGESGKKSTGFIGCDWIHQISITMHSNPPSDNPADRQQRIAMLESKSFLNTLLETAVSRDSVEKRKRAMDLLIWILTIRLQRLRLRDNKDGPDVDLPVEVQQLECVKIVEKHVDALIKNCILCARRSIAKKCVKILLITREGAFQLVQPKNSTFNDTLSTCLSSCIPLLGACKSPGAMRWLVALAMNITNSQCSAVVVSKSMELLEKVAKCLQGRRNPYHGLLRARFGLYGLPLERTIFDVEGPILEKGSATPVTLSSVLTGDSNTNNANGSSTPLKPDYYLKNLYNYISDQDPKQTFSWSTNQKDLCVFGTGLSESQPLHITCHLASDGTKLESSGLRQSQGIGSSLCADPSQLWSAVKDSQVKHQSSQEHDSLDDADDSSLMDCDSQDRIEMPDDIFKEQDLCNIPWSHLVTRPPSHTLVVERMNSGARRYIVLDFGHAVRLTDVIIPSCVDLVSLAIDIWYRGEEIDSVKLAFASDITTRHLILTDIQPPPLCRYMKITTIGRYGMSAVKCNIPLGWFYGEMAEVANVPGSIQALTALQQDLTCRFRLSSGKLMDLLSPYLDLYNGNAAHMNFYFNSTTDADPKVHAAYQECIEIQQQLHTVGNMLRNLSNEDDNNDTLDLIESGGMVTDALLESASTDKLRIMCENIVDALMYFMFHRFEVNVSVSPKWCRTVSPLLWESAPRPAAALATLLPRLCGRNVWWGDHLADVLQSAFEPQDGPEVALDRCLALVMYMCRASVWTAAPALATRALSLVSSPGAQPALTSAVLAALAATANAVSQSNRWDWVTGGRGQNNASSPGAGNSEGGSSTPRGSDCKLHRRKINKKFVQQMQDIEAARRHFQLHIEDANGQKLTRANIKGRFTMLVSPHGSAGSSKPNEPETPSRGPPLLSKQLARMLAQGLAAFILSADATLYTDTLMLTAKIIGQLCVSSSGPGILDAGCILGIARLACTLPAWTKHSFINLLQDLVEAESGELTSAPEKDDSGSGGSSSRVIRVTQDDDIGFGKTTRRCKSISVADVLVDSFNKNSSNFSKPKPVPVDDSDYNQLPLVVESDDSDMEEKIVEQILPDAVKKEIKPRNTTNVIIKLPLNYASRFSNCEDVRLENCTQVASEALARDVLSTGNNVLTNALRCPVVMTPVSRPDTVDVEMADQQPPVPLAQTLYDVFRHLALEFSQQMECTNLESMLELWMILNGSPWGVRYYTFASPTPVDGPRLQLAPDTVHNILRALATMPYVSMRCWVLGIDTLSWLANTPQAEGSQQNMVRVIVESEHFVPAIVRCVNMQVNTDSGVFGPEPYLAGTSIGCGPGVMMSLQTLLGRLTADRANGSAMAILRCVQAAWRDGREPPGYDLHGVLLRSALSQAPTLDYTHLDVAVQIIDIVVESSGRWLYTSYGKASAMGGAWRGNESTSEARLSGLLNCAMIEQNIRRVPLRRNILALFINLARALLLVPLAPIDQSYPNPSASEESQTDESKQQAQTNVDDERKQQATARTPFVADLILQKADVMKKLYRTLSMNDVRGAPSTSTNSGSSNMDTPSDYTLLKDEIFYFVVQITEVAAQPSVIVSSLIEYLKYESPSQISQSMQQLVLRILEKPDVLSHFLEQSGLELAVEKMTSYHQSHPNSGPGFVSSIMNYLKQPMQVMNMSVPASSTGATKKNQTVNIEATNGLYNFAPLCTITCPNPTAQPADVLLGGAGCGPGSGSCAARRVRAAAWSYHFFSTDESSLPLTLTLPYAVLLHEVHLQPHPTSLATCPGAVAIEAGCCGTMSPLGPPQNTAGMTYIRLIVSQPIVCSAVQIRLFKPRDSSNMGLLQLRILGSLGFSKSIGSSVNVNSWARIVSACTAAGLPPTRWSSLTTPSAVRTLSWLVISGTSASRDAHHALLATVAACPRVRDAIVNSLLQLDTQVHAQAFQMMCESRCSSGINAVCELLRQLCCNGSDGCTQAYLQWLTTCAEHYLRLRTAPSAAFVQTLAGILWMLKEDNILDGVEHLITDEFFELLFLWLRDVPENSVLKKSLDSVLCSICYLRPELFGMLLQEMDICDGAGESMEGLTDDGKVYSGPREPRIGVKVSQIRSWQLKSVAAASMSPVCTMALLHSQLPAAVVAAVAEFSIKTLERVEQGDLGVNKADRERADQESGLITMSQAHNLVEWLRLLAVDRNLKDWLGAAGSYFWKPLLHLLCYSYEPKGSWQDHKEYSMLEETTIRLFADVTACHPNNQKLFASTLHNILETVHSAEGVGITGFTRALMLRLLLSSERAVVAVRWAGGSGVGAATPGAHPSQHCHLLVSVPTTTTLRTLIAERRPPMPILDEPSKSGTSSTSGGYSGSVLYSASDPAILSVAEAWKLSLAAGSASKDKRAKDVKNHNIKQLTSKKKAGKNGSDTMSLMQTDGSDMDPSIVVRVSGIQGTVSQDTTIGQLSEVVQHEFGPHLHITLSLASTNEGPPTWEAKDPGRGPCAMLREFGSCGGLALVAGRLPAPRAAPTRQRVPPPPQHDLEWVKLDDTYEDVPEPSAGVLEETGGVPAHTLVVLALLLKLPGYPGALLDEGPRAVHLLRVLLGVPHDEEGRKWPLPDSKENPSSSPSMALDTLPFRVITRLLEAAPSRTDDGRHLRKMLMSLGIIRIVLACLALFTHHKPASQENSQTSNSSSASKPEERNQLYWAKGTGFGTGSTQQSWNVEQALVRQRMEEEHITVLLQVLTSYINPGEKWPPEEAVVTSEEVDMEEWDTHELSSEFVELLANSCLLPAICSYLRNDSVLDMSRHIPLYVGVMACSRALFSLRSRRLCGPLAPLPVLLRQMFTTTNAFAAKLWSIPHMMTKKDTIYKGHLKKYQINLNEAEDGDEGLASLIADIEATTNLLSQVAQNEDNTSVIQRPMTAASREARYIEVMRRLQFQSFELIAECAENGYRFTVPYYFEATVRAAGSRSQPARMKRLAQEAATLATSLPLSYSSSVFVRTDTDRLDVMKVLITGPSDTPYANGCFVLDVYFPAEYPSVPMMINLATTGRHSVRFNPNLYNDGKVCLSVLNTWHGRPEEKWNAHTSSFLQVLVSIQSLILVPEPYFNEPGYERSRGTRSGNHASTEYNSNIYQANVRWAMLDHLRNPEPCFKEVIQTHFWIKRNEIMQTVSGWITELESQSGDDRTQRTIQLNLLGLKRQYIKLQEELARLPVPAGLDDLDEPFQLPEPPVTLSQPPPPLPQSEDIDPANMEKGPKEHLS